MLRGEVVNSSLREFFHMNLVLRWIQKGGRLLMETRRYLTVNIWSERVNLTNYRSFRMKAGRNTDRGLHGWKRWRWEWIFPVATKINTVTGECLGIGRKSPMIDWAAAKYQFVRALNWNNSRNTADKRWREEKVS